MPVAATYDYTYPARDVAENFGPVRLSYWNWTHHLMICAPLAFPFPPDMPFGAVIEQVLPGIYGPHPDWAKIDWPSVEWLLDGEPFKPDFAKSLEANGVGHKSVVRFASPGLTGIAGTST